MAEIEINGQKIEAKSGSMVIEAADNLGIQIPRFCYHRKLPIAANCRMCLVEVEKSPKPLPACATPVTAGMKIWTKTPKVKEAQKSVMEFLLINHPLDCPICDQGGECELQDVSLEYGNDSSNFREAKRVVVDQDLGPLIASDMTRCIQCTRCVRFGSEIAGYRELGATGRGEHLEISTFIQHNMESEVSGNVIDVCPVGALTSKPYRFTARGWELNQTASVSPHDCLGSNLFVHTRQNEVMRVVPKENESINEVWLSDRDRFSYEGLSHKERLHSPKIKKNGIWQEVSWETALKAVLNGLETIKQQAGNENIGVLASPNLSLEEFYIAQKFFRAKGIENLDHRLREVDFRDQQEAPIFPNLGLSLAALENQKVLFLVGMNIHKEQPILGLKCRKMSLAGAKIIAINTSDCAYHFEVYKKQVLPKGDLVLGLAGIAKALCRLTPLKIPEGVEHWLADIEPSAQDLEMAEVFSEGSVSIVMGFEATSHPEASRLRALAKLIALLSGATFGVLTEGANTAGGWLAGFLPHRLAGGYTTEPGYSIAEMLDKNLKGYCLLATEPDLDCIESGRASEALHHADFVCAMSAYESDFLKSVADILLPIAPFTENEGTFVNVEGKWQSVKAMLKPLHQSRPLWKIIRVLGNLASLPGFLYENITDILKEVSMEVLENDSIDRRPWHCPSDLKTYHEEKGIMRIGAVPLYASDGLVRRAPALQKMKDAGKAHLALNSNMAKRLALKEGQNARVVYKDAQCMLVTVIDETIPEDTVFIPLSLKKTVYLGRPYCMVNIYAE